MRRPVHHQHRRQPAAGWRKAGALLACWLCVALLGLAAGCWPDGNQHYTQLFIRSGKVFALADNGTVYDLSMDGKPTQPAGGLPVGDSTGVVADGRFGGGLLYLDAWRKALYVMGPAAGDPLVRRVALPAEIGAPGAMAPSADGILISLDDPGLNASIYRLDNIDPETGSGFQLTRVSDPEQFVAWNVWQIVGNGDWFHCIAGEGKRIVTGSMAPAG